MRLKTVVLHLHQFKLGKWDKEKEEAVMDPNAKMADVRLRQAMGYAIDNDQVGEKFYKGLRRNATQHDTCI